MFDGPGELLYANACIDAYKATAAVQRHIKEMREQAKPLCALCTIKGGFRGLAGRPQGTNKMNEVKRSRDWGRRLCYGGLAWCGLGRWGGGLANAPRP